jgi:hypothetical protein
MEQFNGILFHKSGPANNQDTNHRLKTLNGCYKSDYLLNFAILSFYVPIFPQF